MTREEAISIMNVIVHMLEEKYDTDRVEDAVDMAIKALEQEPRKITLEDVKGYCKPRCLTVITNELLYELTHPKIKTLEQEPCEEQRIGHWVTNENPMPFEYPYSCNKCTMSFFFKTPFCPNCGAKMSENPTGSESEGA